MESICSALFSLLFLLALVLFPSGAAEAVREAMTLCLQTLLPALFPFFIASSLLLSCGALRYPAQLLAPSMSRLFSVGGAGSGALLLGFLGGYPLGARTVAELYRRGAVDRAEAERLLYFCCCSGPGFFLGVCAPVLQSRRAGLLLYLLHAAAATLTGVLHRASAVSPPLRRPSPMPAQTLLEAFPDAVGSALRSCGSVCGFVVFFRLFLRLLSVLPLYPLLPALPRALLEGFFEMTCGVLSLSPDGAGFVACAAITGWGGVSVLGQTAAILRDAALPLRPVVRGKAVHCLLSAALAWGLVIFRAV